MAYPALVVGRVLADGRAGRVASSAGARPGDLGRLPRPADGRRRALALRPRATVRRLTGIPLVNFAGWLLVALRADGAAGRALLPGSRRPRTRSGRPGAAGALPVDLRLLAAREPGVLRPARGRARPAGCAMGVPVALLLVALRQRRARGARDRGATGATRRACALRVAVAVAAHTAVNAALLRVPPAAATGDGTGQRPAAGPRRGAAASRPTLAGAARRRRTCRRWRSSSSTTRPPTGPRRSSRWSPAATARVRLVRGADEPAARLARQAVGLCAARRLRRPAPAACSSSSTPTSGSRRTALARTVGLLREAELDFVSPYPRQVAGSVAERLVQPLLQWSWLALLPLRIAERSPGRRSRWPTGSCSPSTPGSTGARGGHAAVRGAVLEDVALARALRAAGGAAGWPTARGVADLPDVRGVAGAARRLREVAVGRGRVAAREPARAVAAGRRSTCVRTPSPTRPAVVSRLVATRAGVAGPARSPHRRDRGLASTRSPHRRARARGQLLTAGSLRRRRRGRAARRGRRSGVARPPVEQHRSPYRRLHGRASSSSARASAGWPPRRGWPPRAPVTVSSRRPRSAASSARSSWRPRRALPLRHRPVAADDAAGVRGPVRRHRRPARDRTLERSRPLDPIATTASPTASRRARRPTSSPTAPGWRRLMDRAAPRCGTSRAGRSWSRPGPRRCCGLPAAPPPTSRSSPRAAACAASAGSTWRPAAADAPRALRHLLRLRPAPRAGRLATVPYAEQAFGCWYVAGRAAPARRPPWPSGPARSRTGSPVTGRRDRRRPRSAACGWPTAARLAADVVVANADAAALYRDLLPRPPRSSRAASRRCRAWCCCSGCRGRTPGARAPHGAVPAARTTTPSSTPSSRGRVPPADARPSTSSAPADPAVAPGRARGLVRAGQRPAARPGRGESTGTDPGSRRARPTACST